MKHRRRCPDCEGTELLVVRGWSQPEQENSNRVARVVIHAFADGHRREEIGQLELWVCRGCGLARMYAADVGELALWADQPDSGVHTVRGPGDVPYR